MTVDPALKVLLEMRPALDGHAGIPQETRLLFRGLSTLDGVQVEGLLQSSNRVLARGLPAPGSAALARLSEDRRVNRLSRVVISAQQNPKPSRSERLLGGLGLAFATARMLVSTLLGRRQRLGRFEPALFRDFVWRDLFAKTLPVADFDVVTRASYRVVRVPWNAMHAGALLLRRFGLAVVPRLDTHDVDVMVAETPYPGAVSPQTRLVVRYHDAIPLLMPHTITDKSFHQAAHYNALRDNVARGAWFACVSEATRRDLLSVFPQVESRAVTIPNMVSHEYFPEDSAPDRVLEIVRNRHNDATKIRPGNLGLPYGLAPRYLLMVSTLEPRKNHAALLAAWEQIRVERDEDLKLLIVGSLGWDHAGIVKRLRPWVERGDVQTLADVPSAELRVLYRHAQATVCPSFGEGFDFSGVEAMRCGGAVVASDIPVHRDVYGDAAEYFNPYDTTQLVQAIVQVIDPALPARREALVAAGERVSAQYLPERVLPQWRAFLDGLKR
jgi:glycosyltransferase involved in cell wall biosynthesis